MKNKVQIQLVPLGKTIAVEKGVALRDILFDFGVEFPCGGHGHCRTCRVRVLGGSLEPNAEQEQILGKQAIDAGWRLACRCYAQADVTLEISQWEATILADDSRLEFKSEYGLGIAVDVGTTTLVAQLVDLGTGSVLSVQTALNPQAAYGGDIMSRIQYALTSEGAARLTELIRGAIGQLIFSVQAAADRKDSSVRKVVLVGNTVMHHLFTGIDVKPLAHYPFEPERDGLQSFRSPEVGWDIPGDPAVFFLPCLGGFVGSDILAGILATRLLESESLAGLVDLGTNGEVVLGNRRGLLCASTAAGPAFEGARIRMGMRAATGAISEVRIEQDRLRCRVLGGVKPRGLCGSGLVDAVAAGLDLSVVQPSGRFALGVDSFSLSPPVMIYQSDIRELQLAKGAIAAAIRLLLARWGAQPADLTLLHLAGAFGNYVDRASARRIGLIDFPPEIVLPAGNTALHGAKLALFDATGVDREFPEIRSQIEHIPLANDPKFEEVYVESMAFP